MQSIATCSVPKLGLLGTEIGWPGRQPSWDDALWS